jgi:DNA polymerase-3 subunit gamma/tau
MDVFEIDAASNNGVDSVRALREEAVFTPAETKKRVYIIDEVHMLSVSAFNALLKILEEPPEHLIFILATTELHKVPATILSRCQRFTFGRITPGKIAARLDYVAAAEGIALDDAAAELLSRFADGSMRDALSLLDQCAASGEEVTEALVRGAMGLSSRDETAELFRAVANRDAQGAFRALDVMYRAGKSVSALFDELAQTARDALVFKLIPENDELLTGRTEKILLSDLAPLPKERLLYLLSELTRAAGAFRGGASDRIIAESRLASLCDERLELGETALLARIAALEGGGFQKPVTLPSKAPEFLMPVTGDTVREPLAELETHDAGELPPMPGDDDAPPWNEQSVTIKSPLKQEAALAKAAPPPVCEPKRAAETPVFELEQRGDGCWQSILSRLGPPLSFTLADADAVMSGRTLYVTPSNGFIESMLSKPENLQKVRAAAEAELGAGVTVRLEKPGAKKPEASIDELLKFGNVTIED